MHNKICSFFFLSHITEKIIVHIKYHENCVFVYTISLNYFALKDYAYLKF